MNRVTSIISLIELTWFSNISIDEIVCLDAKTDTNMRKFRTSWWSALQVVITID